jgi:hypothetical protein
MRTFLLSLSLVFALPAAGAWAGGGPATASEPPRKVFLEVGRLT